MTEIIDQYRTRCGICGCRLKSTTELETGYCVNCVLERKKKKWKKQRKNELIPCEAGSRGIRFNHVGKKKNLKNTSSSSSFWPKSYNNPNSREYEEILTFEHVLTKMLQLKCHSESAKQ
jgi:hypothetical protein